MRKWLILSALAMGGTLASADRASAFGYGIVTRPYYTSAAFPCLTPSGYFTNSYYYAWYYPWFANYNYSHGPYANWWQWGGYATYGGGCGPYGCGHGAGYGRAPVSAPASEPAAGTVCVTLPADAKLLFNGAVAGGTGAVRTFTTPPLQAGQDYAYDLTAEVTVDGVTRTATERVIVRAGREARVTLAPDATRTAAK